MILFSAIAILLSSVAQAAALAQTTTTPAPTTPQASVAQPAVSPAPTDPKELLEQARKVNGLAATDIQPWHLKASYEVFDENGASKFKGTYEEWWVSGKQYRRSYQSPEFSQVEYGTDHGVFRTQNPEWPEGAVRFVRKQLVDPLPNETEMANANPTMAEKAVSGSNLRCVSMLPRKSPSATLHLVFPSYCFELEKPIVRLIASFNNVDTVLLNRILLFRGRYLGGDIVIARLGKLSEKIHLDLVEDLGHAAADFQPPPDAIARPPLRVKLNPALAGGNLISAPNPVYPGMGTVVLTAIIGTNGHVIGVEVVSGPLNLRNAAKRDVEQAVYTPFTLDGEPVEVETQIRLTFRQ